MEPVLITCQQLVELVTDYVEDRLPLPERMSFEEHLAVCGPCRNYLDQMRETIRLTGSLEEESIAPEARDALLAAFRDWRT
jgi:predicted anti-sigma-YlaC factor YlaD